jgi:outer membrane protein TolC
MTTFNRCLTCFLAVLFVLAGSGVQAQQNEKTLPLSLEECIIKGLEKNLDIAVNVLNPELSDLAATVTREKFYPSLSMDFSKRDTVSASFSFLDAVGKDTTTVTNNFSARLNQLVPTGGTISVTMDGYKTDSNRTGTTINPRYGTTLTFSFNQPLLRNFGMKMTKRDIIVAQNNYETSRAQFKDALINTVYSIEEVYWNLKYNIELLKVREQSLKLAEDLLEKNRRSVEVGTMAPIEILTAESEVATRTADILAVQAQIKNYEEQLKTLLNLVEENPEIDAFSIIPTDSPDSEYREVDLQKSIQTALKSRADLAVTKLNIDTRQLNLSYAKNQLLPDLSLQASYWSPGVSGDQILYLNNNPLSGVIVGVIPGGVSGALKDTVGFNYNNWNVALSLDIPISNILSKASYYQAKVNLKQSLLQQKNQEQQAILEVKNAVRTLRSDFQQVEAYRTARELAERKMVAEEEKLKVGLTTNYLVLLNQREYRNAQVMELRSIIDYNLSLARLNRTLGVTLDAKNIKISDVLSR